MPSPIHQMSADARLLIAKLATIGVGEFVSYTDLSEVISRPVSGSSAALQTAVKRLLRDSDIVFGTVRGEGIKRLADAEIVDEGAAAMNAIRRKARRTVERQMKADFSKLDRERQAKFSAQVSVASAIAMMAQPKEVARLEKAMTPGRAELPINETLRMFTRGGE